MTIQYNTRVTYTGNGASTDFAIPFPYDSNTEVKVVRLSDDVLLSFTIPSGGICRLSVAPANGVQFTIYRDTNVASVPINWATNASVRSSSLNTMSNKFNRAIQEVKDGVLDAASVAYASDLANAVSSSSASAVAAALDAADAENSKNAAASSANQASQDAADVAAHLRTMFDNAMRAGSDPRWANASDMLNGHTSGVAIHVASDTVRIIDTVTPANNYDGSLTEWGGYAFIQPRLCLQADGRSLKWSPHNIGLLYSEDFSDAAWTKTNTTPTGSQRGPDGHTRNGFLLTATNTTSSITRVFSGQRIGQYYTAAFKVHAETSGIVYISLVHTAGTETTYFNLTTGVVGTVHANHVAKIETTDDNGNQLDHGWYYISISCFIDRSNPSIVLGQADADAATAVTNGRDFRAAEAQFHYGANRLKYLKCVNGNRIAPPVDWEFGRPGIIALGQNHTMGGLQSENLTDAAWTKVNGTAAYNAVGPSGVKCSTFTATANNATVIQALTIAGTTGIRPWIRRKTGAGAVLLTVDNGANWVDVTSQISTKWSRPNFIRGAANPTYGLKLAINGDEVEVAMFNVFGIGRPESHQPTYASNIALTGDQPRLATSAFEHSDAHWTLYHDIDIMSGTNAKAGDYAVIGMQGTPLVWAKVNHYPEDGSPNRVRIGKNSFMTTVNLDTRIQITQSHATGNGEFTVNGEPPLHNTLEGAATSTHINTQSGSLPYWINSMVYVPETTDNDSIRTAWLEPNVSGVDPNILAYAHCGLPGETANVEKSRGPVALKLWDNDTTSRFIVFFTERNVGGTGEVPARVASRTYDFDKATKKITIGVHQVVYEQGIWASGLGHSGYMEPIKIEQGPHRGRVLLLIGVQDSVSGGFGDDDRNTYCMHSDDNCKTWSAAVKIVDSSTVLGGTRNVLVPVGGRMFQLKTGAHANRIYGYLYQSTLFVMVYTDDGGDTWTIGTPFNTGASTSEPVLTYRNADSGEFVLIIRNDQVALPHNLKYATSTDFGVTWSAIAEIPSIEKSSVLNCVTQIDPMGEKGGPNGVILVTGPGDAFADNPYMARGGLRVNRLDADYNFVGGWSAFGYDRQAAYNSFAHLYDDVYAWAFEGGDDWTAFNVPGVACGVVIVRYPFPL